MSVIGDKNVTNFIVFDDSTGHHIRKLVIEITVTVKYLFARSMRPRINRGRLWLDLPI